MNTEDQQPITKVAAEKVKNPKRVAQGKKLAEISRAAKARKRAKQPEVSESFHLPCLTTSISLIGALTGVVGTYIAWKSFSKNQSESEEEVSPKPSTVKKPEVKYVNLDHDDI